MLDFPTDHPFLQTLLKDSSAGVRGMAVQAIRYTLPESDEAFDGVLRMVLVDMLLVMLQDKDMEIRRLAMTTLNSAVHNKPDLVLPHLGEMMPFVLSESVIKPELIREVMLGPFKHTVDDGLEVRKVCTCCPWKWWMSTKLMPIAERLRDLICVDGDGFLKNQQH